MTREELDKIAASIVGPECFAGGIIHDAATVQAVRDFRGTICNALVAAYNSGIQTAAVDLETKFKLRWQGHEVALYGVADAVRAKKIGSGGQGED